MCEDADSPLLLASLLSGVGVVFGLAGSLPDRPKPLMIHHWGPTPSRQRSSLSGRHPRPRYHADT